MISAHSIEKLSYARKKSKIVSLRIVHTIIFTLFSKQSKGEIKAKYSLYVVLGCNLSEFLQRCRTLTNCLYG